ncbi:hypothetical protein [Pseudogemmobacter sonorensis]
MLRILLFATLILPAACGADGAPVPPSQAGAAPGLVISGEMRAGVATR